MTEALLRDAAAALGPTRWLIAAWMILAVLHWLTSARLFGPDGLLPWAALAGQRGRPLIGQKR